MPKYRVTYEVDVNLPDAEARQHARWLAERHGLTVTATTLVKDKEAGGVFIPKAGKPGSVMTRSGRRYQVWADAQHKGSVWAVPMERRPGDAPVYMLTNGSDYASGYHANGRRWENVDRDAHIMSSQAIDTHNQGKGGSGLMTYYFRPVNLGLSTASHDLDWQDDSACGPEDDFLHEDRSPTLRAAMENYRDALELCAGCPVRTECLIFGLRPENLGFSILGGMLPAERRQLAGKAVTSAEAADADIIRQKLSQGSAA